MGSQIPAGGSPVLIGRQAKRGRLARAAFLFASSLAVPGACGLALGAPLQRIGRGALSAPMEVRDSIPGKPLDLFDPRTGGPINVGAQRLLVSGELDGAWTPDSSIAARFAGGMQLRSARDGMGGKFIAWTDERCGAADIALDRIGPDGLSTAGWPAGGVLACQAPGSRYQPAVAGDGAGGAILVWTDFRSGDGDIYAQWIEPDGSVRRGWPAGGVPVCTAPSLQSNPRVVTCPGGGAMVVWEDRRSGRIEAFAQRLAEDPVPAAGWPTGGVSLTGEGAGGVLPDLFTDSLGVIYAVWQRSMGEQGRELVAAVVTDDLALGQSPLALTLSSGASAYGEVASVSTGFGSTTLAWSEWRGSSASLHAQRLAGAVAMQVVWPSGGVLVREGEVGGSAPALLAATDSSVAIAWQGHSTESESDVFVQMLGRDGSPLPGWPAGGVAASVARGDQYAPALVGDGAGGVLVSWSDARPGPEEGSASTMAGLRTTAELVSAMATPGRARIVWRLTRREFGAISAARRIGDGAWTGIAAAPDDSGRVAVDDRTVPDGVHAEYRLVFKVSRAELHLEPVGLDIPVAPLVLTLHRVRVLGRNHALLISFALPRGESPRLDLIDVQGRRMLEQRVDGLDPGEQQFRWVLPSRMASGVYFLRLLQGREERTAKVIYIR